jgi:hypothetical protein
MNSLCGAALLPSIQRRHATRCAGSAECEAPADASARARRDLVKHMHRLLATCGPFGVPALRAGHRRSLKKPPHSRNQKGASGCGKRLVSRRTVKVDRRIDEAHHGHERALHLGHGEHLHGCNNGLHTFGHRFLQRTRESQPNGARARPRTLVSAASSASVSKPGTSTNTCARFCGL